ncbi:hypothetical protein SPRG_03805 [Saprolegnia parasitica CBS 223.65]|uniref:Uncharacterized protein n=1 Tax=Saprolegnia parasitica (strain CBS 223.65) TaxID=695850 RepID=A0A067CL25_SAPPC|nr:hypothetical protein SPRG_03805 [Saprolegnia parasitica CBS 223.65]KDO31188.1 hypothetical protein SPRG_03805 [Saprolegnia parasitica CBS 223.65]|eukprot:XP_012197793.1 hypothetical protein SPRG_03805 [Saprolegnia parasitica CBS 223.65]
MAGIERRAAAAATALLHGADLDEVQALLTSAPFLLAHMVRRWATHEPKAVSSARLLLTLASPAQFRVVVTALAPKQQLELLAPPLLPIDLRLRVLSTALEDAAPLAWVQDACFLLEREPSDSFGLARRDNVLRLTDQLRAYGPQSEQVGATLERLVAIGCPPTNAPATPLSLPALRLPMDVIYAMTAPTTGLCPVHVRRLRTLAASGPTALSAVVVLAWDMDTFCKDHLEAPVLGHGAKLVQRTASHLQLCLSSLLDAFLEAAALERSGARRFLAGRRRWAHALLCQLLRATDASWSTRQSPAAHLADAMAHLARVYAAWSISDALHAVYDLVLGAETTTPSDAFWVAALGVGAELVHHQNEASYLPVQNYLVTRAASLVVSRGRHIDLENSHRLVLDDAALAISTTKEALPPRVWSRVLHACLLRGEEETDWIRCVAIDDSVLSDACVDAPHVALALATAVATQLSYPRGRALLCHLLDRNRAIGSVRGPSWPSRVLLADVLGDVTFDDAWTSHSNALVRFFLSFVHDGHDGKALWARCCADDNQFLDALFFSLVTSSLKTSDRRNWTRLWNQIVLWLRQTGSVVAEAWASHLVPPSTLLVAYGERYTNPNANGLPMSRLRLETLLRHALETDMPLDLRALTAFLLHTAVHCVDASHLDHFTHGVTSIRGWLLDEHWSNVLQTALTRISISELPNWICITASWPDLPWARVLERPHVSAALVTLLWQAPAHAATLQQWFSLPALRSLPITSCIIHAARQSMLLGSHASWNAFAATLARSVVVPTKAASTVGGSLSTPYVALDCASWVTLLAYCDDPRLAPIVHCTLMQQYLPSECKGDIDALGQAILTGVLRLSLAQKRLPSWLASPCHLVCTSSALHPCSWLLRSLKRIAMATAPMDPAQLSTAMMAAIDALFLPHVLKTAITTQPSATQWLLLEVRQALHAHAVFRSVGLGPLLVMCLVLAFVVHVPPTDVVSAFEARTHALLQRDTDIRTMLSDLSVDTLVASYCAMSSAKAFAFLARLRSTHVPVVSDEPLAKRPRKESAPPLLWSNLLQEDSWRCVLSTEFEKAYMRRLAAFLALEAERGHEVCPRVPNLLAAFNACPLESVRVVVLGAEPYASVDKATGLCFGLPPTASVSTSLQALYGELVRDLKLPHAPSASLQSLESWAKQGVLLLNAVLSGWELFLEAVLRLLNRLTSHSVFLLLGAALPKRNVLINGAKHLLLDCNDGVSGSHCFSKINAYLEKHGRGRIEWVPRS